MHSTTLQTPFFANHGLHPKFNIQDVNNVVNLAGEDQAMWLADIQTQLVSNLEKAQKRYKENVDKHRKDQPNFKVRYQIWFQQQNIKTIWPSKKFDYQKFGSFTIVKEINIVAFQFKLLDSMKIHLVFVGALP
jgi:hypothetical protein